MIDLTKISTEQRNPESMHIDTLSTLDMLTVINQNDQTVPLAVAKVLPAIAAAVDLITGRLQSGGRLFYLGAGTSGRLGILDAVECPPTYSTEPELVQGLIAGGSPAVFRAQEGAEDKPELAAADLQQAGFTGRDVLVGVAASGRTPYVIGGWTMPDSTAPQRLRCRAVPGQRLQSAQTLRLPRSPARRSSPVQPG